MRNRPKIRAFGKEEAKEVVGVLVCTALPGLVGFGEINEGTQLLLHLVKAGELRAVVETDALNGITAQKSYDGVLGHGRIEARQEGDPEKTAFPVNLR